MPRDMERAVIEVVRKVYGGREQPTPDWLQRPGRAEAGRRWKLIRDLHVELTGMKPPEVMPPRERRTMDCVLQRRGEPPRIIEFDETQHFNGYRAQTIRRYPRSVRVAFDRRAWLSACVSKQRLEGGGFGKPKPPLFRTRTVATASAPTGTPWPTCSPRYTGGSRLCGSLISRSVGSTSAAPRQR